MLFSTHGVDSYLSVISEILPQQQTQLHTHTQMYHFTHH